MEIRISAWTNNLRPDTPTDLQAWFFEEEVIERGVKFNKKILRLYLGDGVNIRIQPADPEKIKALGEKLIQIAKELECQN